MTVHGFSLTDKIADRGNRGRRRVICMIYEHGVLHGDGVLHGKAFGPSFASSSKLLLILKSMIIPTERFIQSDLKSKFKLHQILLIFLHSVDVSLTLFKLISAVSLHFTSIPTSSVY